jgi:putative aldouronate transport system substrate-binding protein
MKPRKKYLAVMATTVFLSSFAMACSKDPGAGSGGSGSSAAKGDAFTGYPMKTDVTLKYWGQLTGNLQGVKATLADVPFFQEWQKRTGVKLSFTSPPVNQDKEALNVMLASGDLPDMIEYNWLDYPGGPEKAIKDGYILKLNDLIDKYCPNLKKYLKEHPEVDRMVKTDNGSYFAFPFIRGDAELQVYQGPILRKDWLDELGLQIPTTIDEWHDVLKAFKEKKGAAAPLSFIGVPRAIQGVDQGAFIGAFGINRGFYIDNNKQVQFGPAQPQYKEFLALMRQWYSEGLLDKNIATVDSKALDANMTSGLSGATIGNAGAGIGKWTPGGKAKDPKFQLIAAPYPVLKKGDTPQFGQKDPAFSPGGMVAITGTSKHPEIAARLLDYGYSEEGHMFFNFGTEGVSYKMENGYPKYTDLLMHNPDKLPPAQVIAQYTRANYNGPFVQDKRYIEQYLELPEQKESIKIWAKTDVDKHQMPPVTPTPEESSEMAKIMNDINTLVDETSLKIILGAEPLDYFDTYVQKLKSLNLDRALQIERAALDRYNKR